MAKDAFFKSLQDEFSSPRAAPSQPEHIIDLREGSVPDWVPAEEPPPAPPPPTPPTPLAFDPDAKAPELLNRNGIRALQRDWEILNLPFDVDDPKTNNLIVATSAATKATMVKVDQNRLLAERNPDALERVIARVKQLVQERAAAGIDPAPDRRPEVTIKPPHEGEGQAMMMIKQSPLPDRETQDIQVDQPQDTQVGQQVDQPQDPGGPASGTSCACLPGPTGRCRGPLSADGCTGSKQPPTACQGH